MSPSWRQVSIAPLDMAQVFVAFGLVPLVLARDFVRDVPPWSFGLVPDWSVDQVGFFVVAGSIIGVVSRRPETGLAAVALGSLLGLAADLWWLAGFVRSEDQAFVSFLPQPEWRVRLAWSAMALLVAVAAGFSIGATVRWLVRGRPRVALRRRAGAVLARVGLTGVGGPLLALAIAWAAASSGLVVPEGSQVQTVRFSAEAISVDPVDLRPGSIRFRCLRAPDALPWGALLVAIPVGSPVEAIGPSDDYEATCDPGESDVSWGTVADLLPGRYAWQQIDNSGEEWRLVATSPIVVVTAE